MFGFPEQLLLKNRAMDINADVKSISQLKDYFFLVPDYQREYVWKPDDQVEQFIIDIDNEFDYNNNTPLKKYKSRKS